MTSAGLDIPTFDELRAKNATRLRTKFNENLPLSSETILGQLNDIFSNGLAEFYEALEEVYQAATPDGAMGAALVQLAGLTGTKPLAQSKSQVTLTLTGTPGTVVGLGKQVATSDSGAKFLTKVPATIGGGGTITVAAESADYGPIVARAGTLTVIATAVSGWTGVTNVEDAVEGRLVETNAQLRLRRENELRAQGGGSVPSVAADVRLVSGVTQVTGFENTSDSTDADGLPPHSMELVVDGGDANAIRAAIFASKPGGIATSGTTTGVVTDVAGQTHTIKFSLPEPLDVYVRIELEVYRGKFPSNGADLVKAAVADWGDANLLGGIDVVPSQLVATIFQAAPGIKAVVPKVGLAADPSGTTDLVVTLRQKAGLDTGRINVVSTAVDAA